MRAIIFLTIIVLISTFSSCSDYLDEKEETRLTVDAIYNTAEGLSRTAVGLYYFQRSLLGREGEVFNDIVRGTDIEVSREGTLGAPSFGFYEIDNLRNYRYLDIFWNMWYATVGKANEIIYFGEQLNSDEFKAKRAIAEAKYFRSLAFLRLYIRFDRIFLNTVPTTPENVNDDREFTAATKEEIFSLISKDLDDAISIFDVTNMGETGRLTKGAARHLRLIVALWMEDYPEAIAQGEAMEASGEYSLVALNDIFGHANYTHSEVISTWQFADALGGSAFSSSSGFEGHKLKTLYVSGYRNRNGGVRTDVNGGYGLALSYPNNYLLNLYDPFSDNRFNEFYRHTYFYTVESAAQQFGLHVGDQIPLQGNFIADWIFLHTGCKKFEDLTTDADSKKAYGDVMQFRYAQTCILMAEAYMRMGNQGKALEWYNKTFTRAGNSTRTQPLVLQDIMDEHARELALEGHRWAFLKRIGKLESQIQLHAGEDGYNITARTNFQPFNVNWPIPQAQLDLF